MSSQELEIIYKIINETGEPFPVPQVNLFGLYPTAFRNFEELFLATSGHQVFISESLSGQKFPLIQLMLQEQGEKQLVFVSNITGNTSLLLIDDQVIQPGNDAMLQLSQGTNIEVTYGQGFLKIATTENLELPSNLRIFGITVSGV